MCVGQSYLVGVGLTGIDLASHVVIQRPSPFRVCFAYEMYNLGGLQESWFVRLYVCSWCDI